MRGPVGHGGPGGPRGGGPGGHHPGGMGGHRPGGMGPMGGMGGPRGHRPPPMHRPMPHRHMGGYRRPYHSGCGCMGCMMPIMLTVAVIVGILAMLVF